MLNVNMILSGRRSGGCNSRMNQTADLINRVRAGESQAVAQLISKIEDGSTELPAIAASLTSSSARAHTVGLTGAPGVGKSTVASALVAAMRQHGKRVAVLAVDPSSSWSGGALLGDRLRMRDHTLDPHVFVRSMASRGRLGGVSAAVPEALRAFDAAGFDIVLVETVGVGQSEIEIGDLVDTTVLVLAPGLGDGIQMIKSGIMDIADIYVINKADRDGADDVVRDLLGKERLMRRPAGVWRPPVVRTVATRREGSEEVLSAIEKHRNWIDEKGDLVRRRCARAKSEIYAIALDEVRRQLDTKRARAALNSYAAEVASGRSDPYSAAAALIAGM